MQRNITLDYFKIVLCILVMTIHMQPLFSDKSLMGWFVSNGVARIAVPCFFLINGYFLHSKIASFSSTCSYLKKIFTIFIVWTSVYIILTADFDNTARITSLIFGIYHLWYLSALIGGVILLYILKKTIKNDLILLFLVIVLFFLGYYIQENFFRIEIKGVWYNFADESLRVHLYKNALFFCLPFLFIGYYIREKIDKVMTINTFILVAIVIVGCAFLLHSSHFYYMHNGKRDFLIPLIIVCPTLFVLIKKLSKFKEDDGYVGLLSNGMYYIHILIIYIVLKMFPIDSMKIYILPMCIFLSALTTVAIIELNKRIKIFL